MNDPSDLGSTLEDLEKGLRNQASLVDEVRGLRTSNRKLRLLLGIVAMVAIFSAVAATVAFVANSESRKAAQVATHAAEVAQAQADVNLAVLRQTCEATNDSRTRTIAVWETFMHIAAPTPTPDEQAKIDQLLGFVRDTYKARDCSASP